MFWTLQSDHSPPYYNNESFPKRCQGLIQLSPIAFLAYITEMIDSFGRNIDYLRVSVTDRCNFRCTYCMPEQQTFLPHRDLLTYDEIMTLVGRFITHGIRKIRLTGGEPLVRRDIAILIEALGQHVHAGTLEELTMTTNGSRLEQFAPLLASAGMKRINVSIDTLEPDAFRQISRGGDLHTVLAGIHAARAHGMEIKINMVALKGENENALLPMAAFCAEHGLDLTLIETMPLGAGVSEREERYISLDDFTAPLRDKYDLHPLAHKSAGPARYWRVEPMGLRIGLITPMSHNFCDQCNRIRLTTDGKIYMCLGSELHVDLRKALREGTPSDVDNLLKTALRLKPQRHEFENQLAQPGLRLARHMNATGG
jgi:cyclic pyranopterin phosphate synthase